MDDIPQDVIKTDLNENKTKIAENNNMELEFDFEKIIKPAIKSFFEIEDYLYLIDNKELVKSNDEYCKKNYINKYKKYCYMRFKREDFIDHYFNCFLDCLNKKDIEIRDIFDYLSQEFDPVEISFASKMLAIINPNKPIWDSNVAKKLGLIIEGKDVKDRIEDAEKKYELLEEKEKELLKDNNVIKYIAEFRKMFPEYDSITDIRVLDFYLWRYGKIVEKTK